MMDLRNGVPGAHKRGAGPGRRALLQRAAIVAGILLIMLLGLLLTAEDDEGVPAPTDPATPALAPLPRLNGQLPEPAAVATNGAQSPSAADPVAPLAEQAGGDPAAATHTPASPAPSPPTSPPAADSAQLVPAPKPPANAAARPGGAGEPSSAAPSGSPAGLKGAPADPVPADAAGAAAGSHRVQLGDFGRVDRAERLARTLAAEGMPAGLQRRVVVGPYVGRDAAAAAAERLSARVAVKGIVVPARSRGQFLVQAGVFSEARNAEALRARLIAAKFKVVVQARVVLGPYETRAGAEKALAKVSGKRNIAGTSTIVSSER